MAIRISDTVPDPTDPISDTVSDATDPISDTVPDPTDPISDAVPDPTAPISDTVPDPTDPISDAVSDATGALSGTASNASGASGAIGHGSDQGLGEGASTRVGSTPSSGGQDVPCDAQTNTCIPDAAAGDSFAETVERILRLLAVTGWGALPWIVIAAGLTALGMFLLRLSRRRTSRT